MKHHLAKASIRLDCILRGLNSILIESADRLCFHDGQLVGKVMKINPSLMVPSIYEAREEIAFLTGKNQNSQLFNINLVQLIKETSNGALKATKKIKVDKATIGGPRK